MSDTRKRWNKICQKHLIGKRIIQVRYMNQKELDDLGWEQTPLVIFFNDGSYMFPSQDDEGNDGGSLFTSFKDLSVIPVI
jgi:hypothetical protein|tara:strand:+ start:1059 stop:1298 length:240 start_codon:yes stop_codon:yes gene_type:complete